MAGLVTLFVACLIGGWVAGRLARRRGGLHGLVVALWLVLLAAVLRLVLPEKRAGLLCCRSRLFDVAFTAIVGAGIVALAWLVDPTRK